MDSATLSIARVLTDPVVGWRAEGVALAEGGPSFDRVLLSAKTLGAQIKVSRELMDDSSNIAAAIETALAGAMALELDRAALFGDGSADSPTGINSIAGILTESMDTPGAINIGYSRLIDCVTALQSNNAPDASGMVMAPRTAGQLDQLVNGHGDVLSMPPSLARIPRFVTSSVPINQTDDPLDDLTTILIGDFRQLLIGIRTALEIRVFDQPLAGNGQLLVVAWMRADVQLAQPKAFVRLNKIGTGV
jgi:HK97 family phage major capsid protein